MASSKAAGRILGRPKKRAADRHDHILSFRVDDATWALINQIASAKNASSVGAMAREIMEDALSTIGTSLNLHGRRIRVRR